MVSIVERVLEAKTKKIKQAPVNSNRASEIGHECTRYLVLSRTRWQEKALHDARLQMIFELGNVFEGALISDLMDAGFYIVEQQRAFDWPGYQITGHLDFKLLTDDLVIPVEGKSSAPNVFSTINTIDDMRRHKYHYMRKYPAQLTIYLLLDGKELGLFLFKNKVTGEIKEIWMELDYDYGESLIQKAEAINRHVKEGTLPDCIEYDDNICGDCGFRHICLPDMTGKEVEIVPNGDELAELIKRYYELKPMASEYDDVDKQINAIVKGHEKLLAGDYYVEGKWQGRTSYDLPEEVKQQYAKTTTFWKKKIIPVG